MSKLQYQSIEASPIAPANDADDARAMPLESTPFESTNANSLAGRYLRQFWHPVFVSREVTSARAMPLRIMGEGLVLYRGESGELHLLEERCAHRGALLSIGKVEDNCLRCRYHGWKYDAQGQCVEQPMERKSFAQKVKLRSYPVREYLGLVWAYLGDGPPPAAPRWPQLEGGSSKLHLATSEFRPFNFFADLENVLDDAHLAFVHSRSIYHDGESGGRLPQLSATETDYGLLHEARFDTGRVKQDMLIMPNCVYFKSGASSVRGLDALLWTVPVDDTSHKIFFTLKPVGDRQVASVIKVMGRHLLSQLVRRFSRGALASNQEEVAAVLSGKKRFEDLPADGLLEDHVVLAAQGVRHNRASERLGSSDVAIILLRKLWTRELTALDEGRPLTVFAFPEGLRPT
jgi:5,5'-dehydrodivanillate O-demethylase